MRAQGRLLPDGRRLHLQDGPIDLVVDASGAAEAVRAAYAAATQRFATVLDELCGELALLRRPVRLGGLQPEGAVARRMYEAVAPFADDTFITPMAAVAGAVAEEVLATVVAAAPLTRASVNNGGDIALHLAPGESVRVGLVDRPDRPGLFGSATVRAEDPVRGVATSGWRGRSFSLGIADAVTILADTAAQADAAATVVANAVDLPAHPAVERAPACEVQHDSDLGDRLVTRGVGVLSPGDIDAALSRGLACAERLIGRGLIRAAALHLQGRTKLAGTGADAHGTISMKPATGTLSRAGEGWGEGLPVLPQASSGGRPARASLWSALPSPGRPLPRALDLSLTGEAYAGETR